MAFAVGEAAKPKSHPMGQEESIGRMAEQRPNNPFRGGDKEQEADWTSDGNSERKRRRIRKRSGGNGSRTQRSKRGDKFPRSGLHELILCLHRAR